MSFTLRVNETVALIGPSGCGKSTLLNIIGGIVAANGGTIEVSASQRVGYLQQEDALLPWMSALENVALPLRLRRTRGGAARRRAAELLRHVGLGDTLEYLPCQLSGGMRQRVALVRALVDRPQLLLLDEPFRSLDGITRHKSYDWFLKIRAEMRWGALLVTHDIEEALTLSERILVLSERPARIKGSLTLRPPPAAATVAARRESGYRHYEALSALLMDTGKGASAYGGTRERGDRS